MFTFLAETNRIKFFKVKSVKHKTLNLFQQFFFQRFGISQFEYKELKIENIIQKIIGEDKI